MPYSAAISCVLISVTASLAADRPDILIEDFEKSSDYVGWTATGEAFGKAPATGAIGNQMPVTKFRGKRLVNTFLDGDRSVGTLTSEPFALSRKYLIFLIGGGADIAKVRVELIIGKRVVRKATGIESERLGWFSWKLDGLEGQQARLRIVDEARGGWGHICADQFTLSDRAREDPERKVIRPIDLAAYRKSPKYYRERWRPQFHFTPEIYWMNDPNGLVYHDGEYHLFYQYNPFGIRWGHMSWGHAVSKDLVRWKHLPLALAEENGVMIFSGCCVVDHKNTSGFGKGGQAPLVAVYTGHSSKKQTQDLAYSNDRGRTWTKFDGNPVLDLNERDFRDPKVFWHETTSQWVMVVSLAVKKVLQFYGSKNLREWKLLSEFGPAGVKKKPNWECPDLFELRVEGTDETLWVLEADMGGGSIAGGSGGEYFVGDFDGREFRSESPKDQVSWVDYGRDFYAPVSFSDIPASDGRRIWIGWINNWETHLLPTAPWRSAQSIPRSLSLRRVDGRLRLIQRPVKELESLRGVRQTFENLKVGEGAHILRAKKLEGQLFEMAIEFELGDAKEFGLELCRGEKEVTRVGYDVEKASIFVDRRKSGASHFHPRFAGRHDGPLQPSSNRVAWRLFLDTSSIEV
ncbi:MAG: glycoside hydrolase family 32 protein, partial [Planctomycetota bacterium]